MSTTYTTAHGIAGSLTHSVRPEIEPETSWFLVGFVSAAPRQELTLSFFFLMTVRLSGLSYKMPHILHVLIVSSWYLLINSLSPVFSIN